MQLRLLSPQSILVPFKVERNSSAVFDWSIRPEVSVRVGDALERARQ